jgi:hypothetical protein
VLAVRRHPKSCGSVMRHDLFTLRALEAIAGSVNLTQ